MWRTNKQTIILLGGSIGIFAGLIGAIYFFYNFIQTESTSIGSIKTAIAVLEAKEKDLNNAKNDVALFDEDIKIMNQSFLSEESFVAFLKLLEGMAQKSGVVFQAETASLPRATASKAELSFVVRGDYPAITRFFSLFDQMPYAGIIDQASIVPDNSKGSAVLSVRAHYIIFNFLSQ